MTSPMPTVSIKYQILPEIPYARESTNGIIKVFASMGGIGAKKRFFARSRVPKAPKSVARLPKITSQKTAPDKIFARRQPTKSPPIAAGVKHGKMQSASEMRS